MKAVVSDRFGPPTTLQIVEVEKPVPQSGQVLIKNYASSLNTVDVIARSGKVPKAIIWELKLLLKPLLRLAELGVRRPKNRIPGYGFAGEIVEITSGVDGWSVGDHVYGYSGNAHAEYVAVDTELISKKPVNLTFAEAAAVPGGSTPAILAFKDLVTIKKDDRVLIIGASGGIGTFAVQIAKSYGAHVTAVCGPSNIDMVKRIGADEVIDYRIEDYTTSSQKYDIIFDVIPANKFAKCKRILTEDGIYISNNPLNSRRHILKFFTNWFTEKKLVTGVAQETSENMDIMREWIENDQVTPVVDVVYPLEKISEAHTHYEKGHSKGRVVISIVNEDEEVIN